MHLTYRKNHGRLVQKKKFHQIIEADIEESEPGKIEEAKALARASIRFTEALIERLYRKGIFLNYDIKHILNDIENVHPNAEIKVEI